MNRPPLWTEAIEIDWSEDQSLNGNIDNISCMQEALTAEWLIEYEFMPDPTELDQQVGYGLFRPQSIYRWSTWTGWVAYDVEDMDKAFPNGWRHFRDTYGEDKTKCTVECKEHGHCARCGDAHNDAWYS